MSHSPPPAPPASTHQATAGSEPGRIPTSLPPPSQGMATRRLQEEANILRRMARLHSPGLAAGTSSAERPHSSQQHGSMAAGPVMERQHYPRHFEEDGGQWDDDDDEDEEAEAEGRIDPQTPERQLAAAAKTHAPLSPALAAARKLLRDMGEAYEPPSQQPQPPPPPPPNAIPSGASAALSSAGSDSNDDSAWGGDARKGEPPSAISMAVVVGSSPQRELATIRQQIKSMQAARKTRASVLHGPPSVRSVHTVADSDDTVP